MRKNRLIALIGTLTMAAAGLAAVSAGVSSKKADSVSAALENKDCIAFTLEDQVGGTSDSRNPVLHFWDITVDSSMGYASSPGTDLAAAGFVNDLENGASSGSASYDSSTNTANSGFTWANEHDGKRYWTIRLPWYVTSCQFTINHGPYTSHTNLTVNGSGSYMIYMFNYWSYTELSIGAKGSSGESHVQKVDKYAISATASPSAGGTATVKGNGGSAVGSGNYFKRQKITAKATANTGYTFNSWSDSGTAEHTFYASQDVALTANFTANTNTRYTVKHYKEDLSGGTYTLADTDNLTGTTGADTAASAKSYEGFTASTFTQTPIAGDGSTIVEIQYTRNSHTLTWNAAGGDLSGTYTSGFVKYGASITPPTATKTGHNFSSWSSTVPETMPNNDVTLTAQWSAKTYTITLSNGGGSGDESLTATYNQKLPDVNVPILSGSDFYGYYSGTNGTGKQWIDASGKAVSDLWTTDGSATLYAYWTVTHTVSFVIAAGQSGWGSLDKTSIIVSDGSTISVSNRTMTIDSKSVTATATEDSADGHYHYEFASFSPNSGTITLDTIITVSFSQTEKEYTLSWDFDEGSTTDSYTVDGKYVWGTQITAPVNVTKTGYEFTGWNPEVVSPLVGKADYTAQYTANTYTIALDRGEATTGDTSVTATYDQKLPDINVPSLTGHTFVGYFTQQDGAGDQYYDGNGKSSHTWETDSDSVTLYAYYTANPYIVTFNSSGGSTPSPATKQVTYGGTYGNLPTVTKLGYVFGGWYDAQTGGNKIESSSTVSIIAPQTLYAHWNLPNYFVQYGNKEKQPLTVESACDGFIYQACESSYEHVYGGETVKFFIDNTQITQNINAGSGSNNVTGTDSNSWAVHNDAETHTYLKVKNNNGSLSYEFWINGYKDIIDPSWIGFESDSTFYVKDFNNGWREASPKIKVVFSSPVGKENVYVTVEATAVAGTDGLFSCQVPKFTNIFSETEVVSWHDVKAERWNSDSTSKWNETSKLGKTTGYHNGIQLTGYEQGSSTGYTYANLFMYADAGVSSGDGLYIDPSNPAMVGWNMANSNLYVRFFSPLGDGVDSSAEGWSEIATLIPGEEHLYQAEVPTLNGSNVQWSGLQVIRCNKGDGRYVPSSNLDISVDIIYSSGILNNRHITLSGEADSQLKQKVICDNNYIDAHRAEAYGTNFLNTCATCDPDGKTQNITSTQWNSCKDEYNAMPSAARSLFTNATALEDSDKKVEAAAARYDYIVGKYGVSTYADYASRNPSNLGGSRKLLSVNNVSSSTWIIATVAIVGVAAIGVFFIYRKRKEN